MTLHAVFLVGTGLGLVCGSVATWQLGVWALRYSLRHGRYHCHDVFVCDSGHVHVVVTRGDGGVVVSATMVNATARDVSEALDEGDICDSEDEE